MVEPAPEGSEEEVKLSVIKPEKPAPVPVGGGSKDEPPEEGVDDGGALDQPAVPPPDEG
jgi:ATP-dependent Clp protease ATP-binding subunit ClpC